MEGMVNQITSMDKVKVTFELTEVGDEDLILIPSTEWILDNANTEYLTLRRVKPMGQPLIGSTK